MKYDVIASVKSLDVTSTETVKVDADNPDDACGLAIGVLRGLFGDDAEIHIQKILRADAGNSAVLAEV